jgi:hypothetical protein
VAGAAIAALEVWALQALARQGGAPAAP